MLIFFKYILPTPSLFLLLYYDTIRFAFIYGGKRVTGVPRGLQNRCVSHKLTDGFDSHVPPPRYLNPLLLKMEIMR